MESQGADMGTIISKFTLHSQLEIAWSSLRSAVNYQVLRNYVLKETHQTFGLRWLASFLHFISVGLSR